MGTFDDLIDNISRGEGPPWGRIAATIIEGVQVARSPHSRKIVDALLEWAAHLSTNAVTHWGKNALEPCYCGESGCQAQALADCAACGERFCLGHVLVSYMAEAICEGCARAAVRQRRGPQRPTAAEARAAALRVLRLKKDASWDDIRRQYKDLVIKHNADRPQAPAKRAKNEERLKEINAAYAVLKQQEAA